MTPYVQPLKPGDQVIALRILCLRCEAFKNGDCHFKITEDFSFVAVPSPQCRDFISWYFTVKA